MNIAKYYRCSWAPYYYNVHIFTNGYYAGVGRFCESLDELITFCKYYECEKIEKIPEV